MLRTSLCLAVGLAKLQTHCLSEYVEAFANRLHFILDLNVFECVIPMRQDSAAFDLLFVVSLAR